MSVQRSDDLPHGFRSKKYAVLAALKRSHNDMSSYQEKVRGKDVCAGEEAGSFGTESEKETLSIVVKKGVCFSSVLSCVA